MRVRLGLTVKKLARESTNSEEVSEENKTRQGHTLGLAESINGDTAGSIEQEGKVEVGIAA